MQIPNTTNQTPRNLFMTRVTQGVMLGTVLAVPVALWAYTQAVPQPEAAYESVSMAAKAPRKSPGGRKPPRVREAQTIPASQMHIRIDDGRRPPAAEAN